MANAIVLLMLSRRGDHAGGVILGNPESVKELTDDTLDDSNSGSGTAAEDNAWVDSGLRPVFKKARRSASQESDFQLLVVVARAPIMICQKKDFDPPDISDELNIAARVPVASEGMTSYANLVHPDTRTIWVKMPHIPDAPPDAPWWRGLMFWKRD